MSAMQYGPRDFVITADPYWLCDPKGAGCDGWTDASDQTCVDCEGWIDINREPDYYGFFGMTPDTDHQFIQIESGTIQKPSVEILAKLTMLYDGLSFRSLLIEAGYGQADVQAIFAACGWEKQP